ncbi:hypothetical protein BDZ85DRAFT_64754 [Elsinoe ampelina]|uniref:Uncharacterized protein n=1 Tax=Elsinoe ampelina TaxID=302913 RepID=A0A6A6G017_9PEZI|nr:hypothetical protein BDZ85DRAFT_64754 [Elsinoe ampelina]
MPVQKCNASKEPQIQPHLYNPTQPSANSHMPTLQMIHQIHDPLLMHLCPQPRMKSRLPPMRRQPNIIPDPVLPGQHEPRQPDPLQQDFGGEVVEGGGARGGGGGFQVEGVVVGVVFVFDDGGDGGGRVVVGIHGRDT